MNSTTNSLVRNALSERAGLATYWQVAILLVISFWATTLLTTAKAPPRVPGAKVVGHRAWWEPPISLQFRFFYDSANIVFDGYRRFKDSSPYVVRRYDADITIFPMKYLEQIRSFPRTKLNRSRLLNKAIIPRWNGVEFTLRSDLVDRVLTSRLTPNLDKYLADAQDEGNFVWNQMVPQSEDWVETDIHHVVRGVVAATSARVFVGLPACRNPDWLSTSVGYAEDLNYTSIITRLFPEWMHPVAVWCNPFRWRLAHHYKVAGRITAELLQARKAALDEGREPEDTLLSWMMDKGSEQETELDEMAARLCVLNTLSIHTTSLSVSCALFRLCSNPEWFQTFREEVEGVVQKYGWIGEGSELSPTEWTEKLEKMDSLIIETQRLDPIFLIGLLRVALDDVQLKDGTKIPAGTNVAVPAYHYINDPDVTPDPEAFDPLRAYRKRYANNGEHYDVAGVTSPTQLTFGHGGQACPGRYFAVHQIKFVLSRLLVEHDFSWPGGKAPTTTFFANEINAANPWAKMMMRKRKTAAV